MCVIHIKLSKLKGHLTPPLPSLILSPSPSLSPLSLCYYTRTHTHARLVPSNAYMRAHTLYIHIHTHTHTNFNVFFSKGTCWEVSFMMFCSSSVALGCKTHLRAARQGIAGYLIWCEKGWWMLFACCIDVQIAVWMLPQQGTTVIVWLASKQVYQMISALAYFTILGEKHESPP